MDGKRLQFLGPAGSNRRVVSLVVVAVVAIAVAGGLAARGGSPESASAETENATESAPGEGGGGATSGEGSGGAGGGGDDSGYAGSAGTDGAGRDGAGNNDGSAAAPDPATGDGAGPKAAAAGSTDGSGGGADGETAARDGAVSASNPATQGDDDTAGSDDGTGAGTTGDAATDGSATDTGPPDGTDDGTGAGSTTASDGADADGERGDTGTDGSGGETAATSGADGDSGSGDSAASTSLVVNCGEVRRGNAAESVTDRAGATDSGQTTAAGATAAARSAPDDADVAAISRTATQQLVDMLECLIAEPGTNLPDYDRDNFAGWRDTDGDCINTRHEVLLLEVDDPATISMNDRGCLVTSGQWFDDYTDTTYYDSRDLDVDHVVALADAWVSGAYAWADDLLDNFSNFVHNLNAIAAGENRSKSARGPADYSPSHEGARCGYWRQYAEVKVIWVLRITQADFDAVETGLSTCDFGATSDGSTPPPPPPTTTTTTQPSITTTTTAADCHPAYSPCLPNRPGDALNCGDLSSDQKPVTVLEPGIDPYRLDRDGDGTACTS